MDYGILIFLNKKFNSHMLNIILNKFNIIVSFYYYLCRIFYMVQLKKVVLLVKVKYRIIFFLYEIWFLKVIDFKYLSKLFFIFYRRFNPILIILIQICNKLSKILKKKILMIQVMSNIIISYVVENVSHCIYNSTIWNKFHFIYLKLANN